MALTFKSYRCPTCSAVTYAAESVLAQRRRDKTPTWCPNGHKMTLEARGSLKRCTDYAITNPLTCCTCGIQFDLPDALLDQRKRDYCDFWCPNGHAIHITKPDEGADPRDAKLEKLEARAKKLEEALGLTRAWLTMFDEEALETDRRPTSADKVTDFVKGLEIVRKAVNGL